MKERVFLDTNVLVRADDLDAGDKHARARELLGAAIRGQNGVLSTQVLQEFFVVATRKLGVEVGVARRKSELLSALDVVSIQVPHVLSAIDLHRLHPLGRAPAMDRTLRDLVSIDEGHPREAGGEGFGDAQPRHAGPDDHGVVTFFWCAVVSHGGIMGSGSTSMHR